MYSNKHHSYTDKPVFRVVALQRRREVVHLNGLVDELSADVEEEDVQPEEGHQVEVVHRRRDEHAWNK